MTFIIKYIHECEYEVFETVRDSVFENHALVSAEYSNKLKKARFVFETWVQHEALHELLQ